MPTAEIIAIGTELLLGEIQDTNTSYLARKLRDIGVDIFRSTLIGDNEYRISELIKEASQRADIIITTGGLGPTVDDPTRNAVALAVGSPLEYREELWHQILDRFTRFNRKPTENNRKQAFIPKNAVAIENPVGTAPSFFFDTGNTIIISLPGVPKEMEMLCETSVIPLLKKRFNLQGIIKVRVLHLAGVGESIIDELIKDFETCSNPTVGLLAKSGQIDVRITSKDNSLEEANKNINEIESKLRDILKEHIYGVDDDTLEKHVLAKLEKASLKLAIIETSGEKMLSNRLHSPGIPLSNILVHESVCDLNNFDEEIRSVRDNYHPEVLLAVNLEIGETRHKLQTRLVILDKENYIDRYFGGSPALVPGWGCTTALDILRRHLPEII